jgi:hypothetical protein
MRWRNRNIRSPPPVTATSKGTPAASTGAAAAGGDHLVEHAVAEHQHHGQPGPVDRLDGQDDQQLPPTRGPDSRTASRHSRGSRRNDRSTSGDS